MYSAAGESSMKAYFSRRARSIPSCNVRSNQYDNNILLVTDQWLNKGHRWLRIIPADHLFQKIIMKNKGIVFWWTWNIEYNFLKAILVKRPTDLLLLHATKKVRTFEDIDLTDPKCSQFHAVFLGEFGKIVCWCPLEGWGEFWIRPWISIIYILFLYLISTLKLSKYLLDIK